MANIGSGELSNSIPTIVAAEALGYLQANTVAAQLFARDWEDEVSQYGDTVSISQTGSLSVNSKSADTAVTLQTPSDSAVTVTLDQHKEVSFLIEDIGRTLARPDMLSQYMEDAMAVVVEEVDSDLLALYSGFSQTIDATAGMDEEDFRESRRLLNAAKAPLSNRFAILHEDAEYELLGISEFVNSDFELGDVPAGLLNSFTSRFFGFNVFTDQMVNIDTAEAKNIFAHKNAATLASRPLAGAPAGTGVIQSVMNEGGVGVRSTISYSADHLGVQVTLDLLYGVAEVRDNHAIVVSTTEQ